MKSRTLPAASAAARVRVVNPVPAQVYAFAADLVAAGGAAVAKRLAAPGLAAIQLELYGGAPVADAGGRRPKPSKKRKKRAAGAAADDLPADPAAAAAAADAATVADGDALTWAGGRPAARDAAVQAAALHLLEALLQVGTQPYPTLPYPRHLRSRVRSCAHAALFKLWSMLLPCVGWRSGRAFRKPSRPLPGKAKALCLVCKYAILIVGGPS